MPVLLHEVREAYRSGVWDRMRAIGEIKMTELTHLSLFSGIGGLDLAAEAAGFKTVGQCEWADYPTKVLEKHWPDVPRWRDIRTLTGDDFYARTGRRSVTAISGGFPCQPFSVAGKRRGKEDDRYLWPEMCRVISEIRPAWVIGENVPGIVNLALDTVLSDLESQGYACQTFIIPACGVDAPHRRERIAIVANTDGDERTVQFGKSFEGGCDTQQINSLVTENSNVSNSKSEGLPERQRERKPGQPGLECGREDASNTDPQQRERNGGAWGRWPESGCCGWWPAEPDVGRVANGIPSRVDRLKCLGNAVVPAQFYPFFKYIAEIERKYEK